jgi:hypothetical protein
MACKIITLTPFTRKIESPNPNFVRGGLADKILGPIKEDKIYTTVINECNGNTTVFEINKDKSKTPILTISGTKEVQFVNKETDNITKKSLIANVQPEALKQRLEHIKSLPPDDIIKNGLTDIVETPEDAPPDAKAEGTAANREDLDVLQNAGVDNANKDISPLPTNLYYPEKYKQYKQDYIKFQILEYKPRIFTKNNLARNERYKNEKGESKKDKFIKSTIILPIQGGITDSNTVNWNGDPMNAIEQAAAFASLQSQTSMDLKADSSTMIDALGNLAKGESSNKAIKSYIQSYLSRMAANSSSNFFSRGFGAILNPNLELLFQTPELRSFGLRFDLTPRDKEEAKQVKQIIRVFKQTMAPRKGVAEIFLKTPMIFDITYINGKLEKEHTSINKIKTCALKMFNVNYTPNNQYMTYDDAEATMTGYSLEMQFQELEPVFYDDYIGMPYQEIGY